MGDILLYLTTVLIWGSTWLAITFQLGVVPIEWSLVYRFALAAALLFLFCLASGRKLGFSKKSHLYFAGLGIFLFSANYYFVYAGTQYISSGLVAVVFSLLPLMNILNGMIFMKRPGNRAVALASLMGVFGIGFIFWPELSAFSFKDTTLLGAFMIILATYLASLGNTIASSRGISGLSAFQSNAWGMFYGTLFLTLFALLQGRPPAFDPAAPYVISLVYLSVFGTIIAFVCYFLLIRRISVERASYITIAFPIVALTLSTLFEGYQWSAEALIGMILVLGGNYYILRTRARKAPI